MSAWAKMFEQLAGIGTNPLPKDVIKRRITEHEKENRRYWAVRRRLEEDIADDFEDLSGEQMPNGVINPMNQALKER